MKLRKCLRANLKHFFIFIANNIFGDLMKNFKKNIKRSLGGVLIGVINGLLGSGGGMLAVPVLKRAGFDQRKAQANAIAVILPISIVSCVMYLIRGDVNLTDGWSFLPGGILGAVIGTFLLSKIPTNILRKIFAAFMIWAGVRLLTK